MRKSNPTLVSCRNPDGPSQNAHDMRGLQYYGSFESLDMDNPLIWAYKRRSRNKCYLTVLNFSPSATSWRYADHGVDLARSEMLISNHQTCEAASTTDVILLRPFEGRLYQLMVEEREK